MSKSIYAKEYEDYIITGKEESLNSLVPTSIEKEYFTLIRRLLNEDLTPKLQKEINKFVESIPEEQAYRIKALNIFKKLQKNPNNKSEIIENIKSLFNLKEGESYSKPYKYQKNKNENNEENKESDKYPNSLDVSEYNTLNKFIQDIYDNKIDPNDDNYYKIFNRDIYFFIIDFNKIPKEILIKILTNPNKYDNIKAPLLNSLLFSKIDYFKKIIKLVVDKCKDSKEYKENFTTFIKNNKDFLLNEQIEELSEYKNFFDNKSIVLESINRKFFLNNEKHIEKLKKFRNIIDKYNIKNDKICRKLLLDLIETYSEQNIYDLDLFIEYIKLPLNNISSLYNINNDLENQIQNLTNDFDGNFSSYDFEYETNLISKCLKYFYLKKKVEFKKLDKYFNRKFIKNFYAKMQFYLGNEEYIKNKYITTSEINDLMKEIVLNICDYNKETFNVDEDIELILEIKNINTLYVNIYEINTENYYYCNEKKLEKNISLDGIVPTYEDIYSYNEKPQILQEKTIKISKLPKKRGLYVIEFIGNGHVSRAIIQKGNLNCIHKNTVNGKVFYIMNEENKICKGEKTGIWINNIWYPSNKDTGTILIPYSVNGYNIILKHEDFCCLETNINIPNENYELSGQFIINKESFIMGNVTKVLVRPYLFVCNEICPLDELKNVKLTIKTIITENNQDIPSYNVIDNIKLSYDNEYSFEFQVPPKLKYVEFELSGEIQPKTKDKIEELKIKKEFNFTRKFEYDIVLKQDTEGNYFAYIIGRNGEPKKNHEIEVTLKNIYSSYKYNKNKNILMETDSEGKIALGKLENISEVKIGKKTFGINSYEKFSYPPSITILENQEINLPIFDFKFIHLTKIYDSSNLENLTDLLKIKVTDEKKNLRNLTIPKLPAGKYVLYLNNKEINIEVIKGKSMDIKGFIIDEKGNIIYNETNETPIAIENISYNNKELKIKLNKNNKNGSNPRIHISASQYRPKIFNENLMNFFESPFYRNKISNNGKIKVFEMTKEKNIYLNNKILSDEMQYILDRKQYDITLGNSLQKPSLLLKPQYTKDTNTEIKEGKKGRDFDDLRCCKKCKKCYDNDEWCYDRWERRKCDNSSEEDEEEIDYDDPNCIFIHDFINISPFIEDNLIPDENGEIILKDINLEEYSFLNILCFDKISSAEDCFYLKNGKTSLRDLRAVSELDINKNYCEFRRLYPLSKKDKHNIKDITSIKYKIFDSIEKYVEFIKIVNSSLKDDIKQFEFLLNFNNLSLAEKIDKISIYFCHEVNIYLYFHHNDFFNHYIYPIIKYKSEKTFIDYFLLDDKDKILEYVKQQKISELNVFEKCLLIYSIRKNKKKLANRLARIIRSECPIENQKEIKRLFNIALNLKFEDEPEVEKEYEVKSKSKSKKKKEANKKSNSDEDNFDIDEDDAKIINAKAQLFKESGKTKEYCETQYFNKVFKNSNNSSLIKPTNFFADLALFWSENIDSERNIGFKSENILTKPDNITEFMFMLAVLDLEEKTLPQSQKLTKDKGLGLTIEVNTNAYLLTKEINEAELNIDNKYSIILAQMAFEDNRQDKEENEVTKFLTGRRYLLKTIVTNISPDNIICEVLMQIPDGSIPVNSDEYKIIETANISSYKSIIFKQKFYFPEEGVFKQYPSTASINNLVIAKSGVKTYEVVSSIKLSKEEITSIEDVLNQGSKKEILEFIKNSEILREEDLKKIYWMLKDKDFYTQFINILKDKYLYNSVFNYSLNHEDIETLPEYILSTNKKNIFSKIGNDFDYKFLKIDKTNNAHILNHLDYHPIANSRVFKLPKSKSILTTQLRDTYCDYISYLITLPKISDYEYLRLCYYLILQQRIKDAEIVYNKIDKKNIIGNDLSSLELQYDYLTAYLDFCNGYPKFEKAREISQKYKNIPILSWKNMFNEIEYQLNEYDQINNYKEKIKNEEDESSQKVKDNSESGQELSIDIKNKEINIIYKNVSELVIKYYLIDIEILFSRSPFVQNTKVDFGFVKPIKTDTISVNKEQNENIYSLKITDDFKNKNFFIEVSSGKKKENSIYNSSLLKYSLIEAIGEIKVMTPDGKGLPKVYIKCFCETNNKEVKFYKDGFTDLRGKFDYVSLNNDLINNVNKFSILMVSKEYGSMIVSCNPPKMIKENDGEDLIEKMFDYKQKLKNKLTK